MRQNLVSGSSRWTSNNCESVNHMLKQAIDWRPQQLPDLIDTLRQLVNSQYTEADRAMCGVGDFVLRSSFVKHRLTIDAWRTMTVKQRNKAIAGCFKLAQSTETASDGGMTLPNTPGGGKSHISASVNRQRNDLLKQRKLC